MSGFLRRLAERTLRPTPAAHSQARLPFAPLPLLNAAEPPEQSAASAPPLPPATADAPLAAAPPNWEATDLPPANPLLRRSTATPVATARRTGAEPTAEPAADPTAEPAAEPPLSVVARQPAFGLEPSVTVSLDEDRTAHPSARPAAAIPDEPSAGRIFSSLVAVAPVEPEPGSGREPVLATAAASPTAPAPRRALSARPIVAHPPLPDQRPSPMAQASSDDIPTVHVTIGRIDITAVHAPPPTKPKPAPVRPPQSLDEYLAQRNRGRP